MGFFSNDHGAFVVVVQHAIVLVFADQNCFSLLWYDGAIKHLPFYWTCFQVVCDVQKSLLYVCNLIL